MIDKVIQNGWKKFNRGWNNSNNNRKNSPSTEFLFPFILFYFILFYFFLYFLFEKSMKLTHLDFLKFVYTFELITHHVIEDEVLKLQ